MKLNEDKNKNKTNLSLFEAKSYTFILDNFHILHLSYSCEYCFLVTLFMSKQTQLGKK